MPKPLEGYRVVDMTHVLAGPYCTYQLGMLGAEVIKVEAPKGDMVRGWGGTDEQVALGLGSGFVAQNAGKRSIVIDVRCARGAELVTELLGAADIFVQNYRPGSLARYGLGVEALRDRLPKLIYASISAFGHTGAEGPRPGFDDVVQARSGFMSINVRGDGPIRTGGPVLDYATGMHATSAILAAVLLKERTGEGQHVDVAMQDVTLLLMNRQTSMVATTGVELEPPGNREGPMLGRFETRDGYVMLAGYLPHHCRTICAALGLGEFAELNGREMAARSDEIECAVEARLRERSSNEWDEEFANAGVVAGGVRDISSVFEGGQPEARDLVSTVESAAGDYRVTNTGYRINDAAFAPAGRVPRLGEDTHDILRELGYGDADIDRLVEASVVNVCTRQDL